MKKRLKKYKTLQQYSPFLLLYCQNINDILYQYMTTKIKEKAKKKKKKKRYPRDEALYNIIQKNKPFIFFACLPFAVEYVLRNRKTIASVGKPPRSMYDRLICLAVMRQLHFDLRESEGWLNLFKFVGLIDVSIPCFKSLSNYLNDPITQHYLDELLKITSNPLKFIETCFVTDSYGVRTNCFSSWYSLRTNKQIQKRDHMQTHVTSTVKLNAAVCVDCCKGKDPDILIKHTEHVGKTFNVEDWTADSKYWVRKCCNAVSNIGGTPWFMPTKAMNPKTKPKNSPSFKNMNLAFYYTPKKAKKRYHKRSNGESTFAAKQKWLDNFVRSKLDLAKENEEKLAWVVYNFGVLARALYEYDIIPNFMEGNVDVFSKILKNRLLSSAPKLIK